MVQRTNDLALVAHELGGALTPVRNAVDLVRGGAAGALAPDAVRLLEIAARGLGRADRVLQNVRALAAPESFHPARNAVALGAVVADLCGEFAPEAAARAVQIELESTPEVVIPTDRGCFEQILVNLLSNALKFTPPGGRIRLRVDASARAVLPGHLALLGGGFGFQPRFARLEVEDSGIGLSEEARRRLFEPFWRAPEARALGTPGMGLGLTVARRLAELLHGDLRALPAAAAPGSRFVITLPGDAATLDLVGALDEARRELEPRLESAPQALALLRCDRGFAPLDGGTARARLGGALATSPLVCELSPTTWLVGAPVAVRALAAALPAMLAPVPLDAVQLHVQRTRRGAAADEFLLQAVVRCRHRLLQLAPSWKEADDASHPAGR